MLLGVSVSQCTEEAWLLSPDDPVRKWLYNLCHVINHLNAFGGGDLSRA
ncbi:MULTISPECIES: hypothetical protein [unclassified Thiocapsa]